MPSQALKDWKTVSAKALDEIAHAHKLIGGTGRGRRYATQQVNQAYAVLLCSQFQKFCRDLHTECVDILCGDTQANVINQLLKARLTVGRRLDRGNPNLGNICHDFQWFGIDLSQEIRNLNNRNNERLTRLADLNTWRNAIAHQDFSQMPGRCTITLNEVANWRRACDGLAHVLDKVMYNRLLQILTVSPW